MSTSAVVPVIRVRLDVDPAVTWMVDVATLAEFIDEGLEADGGRLKGRDLLEMASTALSTGDFGAVSDSPVTLSLEASTGTVDVTVRYRDFVRQVTAAAREIPGAAERLAQSYTFYLT